MNIDRRSLLKLLGATALAPILPKLPIPVVEDYFTTVTYTGETGAVAITTGLDWDAKFVIIKRIGGDWYVKDSFHQPTLTSTADSSDQSAAATMISATSDS